jgi:hypothetical protein
VSVRSEFVRLVGEAERALRAGSVEANRLADSLRDARERADGDLPGAAARVLALCGDGAADRIPLSDAARERLDAAAERMLAVSRIILGR